MNSFAMKFTGAAVVGLVGFILCLLQTQWVQFVGIVLMSGAISMGVMGELGSAKE